jgi:uncharacterized protein YjbI with pentapeptide repeats
MRNRLRKCRSLVRLTIAVASLAIVACAQQSTCPDSPNPGKDFQGQTLVNANFSFSDLTNANFSNATLVGPVFRYANLTNANFQGAVFVGDNVNPSVVGDFGFSNLTGACFRGARFDVPTYFTEANLTCADFSNLDLTNENAIFAEGPLNFERDRSDCRLKFRSTKMNCEFVSDWRYLDLAGADIKACTGQLAGQDFSDAKLTGVNLAGEDLDGDNFKRADLTGAMLNDASLRDANLSEASLEGAHLDHVNLSGASLYRAFLSNDTQGGVSNAATVRQSHLKNVNLSFAQLSGVDFTYSNFYGDDPTANDICKTAVSVDRCNQSGADNYKGFACRCASAHGATMTRTNFSNAYLYGVDFTDAQGQGVIFSQAILTGANFNGSVIRSDPQSGSTSTFFRAFLQGTNLSGIELKDRPTLANAFLDFRPGGNNIFILLDGGNHNDFPCPGCTPPAREDVCVLVNYSSPSKVPDAGIDVTCPNGFVGNCGTADPSGSNKNWESTILDLANPPSGVPPAWYEDDSTFIQKPGDPGSICKGKGPESAVIFW